MAFNSPVWFNVGVQAKPQCSACFINSVHDDMESIMGLTRTEGMLFKWGSGTGTNLPALRGSKETLSGGGIASGPVSFMKGFDAFAGVIKSGGKTRRAAKMVILNVDHPDIVEFIECKHKEEAKAHALIRAGYDSAIDGAAYTSIFFQNANHSVRVTDDFMRAVEQDKDWWTKNVTDGQPADKLRARDLIYKMAESTWLCGDPGMQYDTTVNRWHTCKTTARINASNPCSSRKKWGRSRATPSIASRCWTSSACIAIPSAASSRNTCNRNYFSPRKNHGTMRFLLAKSTASRIPRSLSSLPPAPSAS